MPKKLPWKTVLTVTSTQYAVCIGPVCIEKEVEEEDADWHCEVRHRIEHCTAGSTFTIKKLNVTRRGGALHRKV